MKVLKVFFIGLLFFYATSCGGGGSGSSNLSNDSCGVIGLPTRNLKIINGSACGSLSQSPVVRLVMFDVADNILGYCTGTFISKIDILTAGHCVINGIDSVAVVYGDAGSQRVASVTRIRRHPNYQAISRVGDTFAAFNDLAIYSIGLDIGLPFLPIGTSVKVTGGEVISVFGYGLDEAGTLDFAALKSGEMRVNSVTENHISSLFDGDGSNTCQGDSGGPAIFIIDGQATIVGVTSSGSRPNCREGDNSLFTSLQSQSALDFIFTSAPEAATL